MTKETPRQASVNVTYQKKVKSKKAGGAKKRPASVMAEYNEGSAVYLIGYLVPGFPLYRGICCCQLCHLL